MNPAMARGHDGKTNCPNSCVIRVDKANNPLTKETDSSLMAKAPSYRIVWATAGSVPQHSGLGDRARPCLKIINE